MRYYYIEPPGGSAFQGPFLYGRKAKLIVGGRQVEVVVHKPDPSVGYYDQVPHGLEGEQYKRQLVSVALDGPANGPDTRAVETAVNERYSLGELHDLKREDVYVHDHDVRYNAVDTSLHPNWWLVITERSTTELFAIASGSNSRQIAGQDWPLGPNAPWVGIYNANTKVAARRQITGDTAAEAQAMWDTLEIEWGQHLQATGNATAMSDGELQDLVDAAQAILDGNGGDVTDPAYHAAWDAVAAHDPEDPRWGYPPTIDKEELDNAVSRLRTRRNGRRR